MVKWFLDDKYIREVFNKISHILILGTLVGVDLIGGMEYVITTNFRWFMVITII